MDNPRPEKVAVVTEVRNRLDAAEGAILTEYRGLTVKDLATLRRSLRDAGAEYKIYKNTLVRLAVNELGLTDLTGLLEGPTAIAFVEGDAVNVAKVLRDFGRINPNLVVKGGLLGTSVLTPADAAALADIPPREVLLARLAGGLAAPMQKFAGLLQALPRNFAYGLKALIDAGGNPNVAEAPAPAVVEEPPAEPEGSAEITTDVAPADEASAEPSGEADNPSVDVEPAPPVDSDTTDLAEQAPPATANTEPEISETSETTEGADQ
ncbi:MAG TPA: 50S ribosomal protein L10 [Acidimicrobiales bacterium]|nr:50S ribosomal protein L10 [Acidimicrobiales bacterium]